nr:helix-turn-helix transcriptional regulator [uncultured Enterobacter sp.]
MQNLNWNSADIIAALKKRGTSMAKLSRDAGLSSSTLANALHRPWPKGESIIAQAIDVSPKVIWPDRYTDEFGREITRRFRQARKRDIPRRQ